MDEIPTALRETRKIQKSSSINSVWIISLLGLGFMGLLFFSFTSLKGQTISVSTQNTNTDNNNNTSNNSNPQNQTNREIDPEYRPNSVEPEHLLGHLPYQEVSPSQLKAITSDGRIKLKSTAAEKFKQMQRDARANGIILVPLSGFRTISEQEHLFFDIKEQRAQVASKRAEVSAPPGHSEHHTGYAVDIGDGKVPATNLSPNFEKTAAYKWLAKNAAKYSFELSFAQKNLQGISYEPWHWRFIGDTDSLETFYKARNLKSKIN